MHQPTDAGNVWRRPLDASGGECEDCHVIEAKYWLLMAALVGGAACDDPSIDVEVEVDQAYQDLVTSYLLQVLVPPSTEPYGCDDVAYRSEL